MLLNRIKMSLITCCALFGTTANADDGLRTRTAPATNINCFLAYGDYVSKVIQGDKWLQIQLSIFKMLTNFHSKEPAWIVPAVASLFAPITLPVAAGHDVVVKIRRYINGKYYNGVLMTYALQSRLYDLKNRYSDLSSVYKVEDFEARTQDLNSMLVLPEYTALINSEPFLKLAESRNETPENYPQFTKMLLSAYMFGPQFCGKSNTLEIKSLLDIDFSSFSSPEVTTSTLDQYL